MFTVRTDFYRLAYNGIVALTFHRTSGRWRARYVQWYDDDLCAVSAAGIVNSRASKDTLLRAVYQGGPDVIGASTRRLRHLVLYSNTYPGADLILSVAR